MNSFAFALVVAGSVLVVQKYRPDFIKEYTAFVAAIGVACVAIALFAL